MTADQPQQQQQQTATRLVQQQHIIAQAQQLQTSSGVQLQHQQHLTQVVTSAASPLTSNIGTIKSANNIAVNVTNSPNVVNATGAVKSRAGVATIGSTALASIGLQGNASTIMANLQPGQRIVTTTTTQNAAAQKNNLISYTVNAANKNLTPSQLHLLKQQYALRQQAQLKNIQSQIQTAGGQKMSITLPVQQRNAALLKQQPVALLTQHQAVNVSGKQSVAARQVNISIFFFF